MNDDAFNRYTVMLVDAIRLLYYQSQLNERDVIDTSTILNLLSRMPAPGFSTGPMEKMIMIKDLREFVERMCHTVSTTEFDKDTLLGTLSLICKDDKPLYESIKSAFDNDDEKKSLHKKINTINNNLLMAYRHEEVEKILAKASDDWAKRKYAEKGSSRFIGDVIEKLEPLQIKTGGKEAGVLEDIDFSDIEIVNDSSHEETGKSPTNLLITGLQGVNRMLNGGFKRGHLVLNSARAHCYKSSFNLTIQKDIALYNKPQMIDAGKKPLILRISFEDDGDMDVIFLYQALKMEESYEEALKTNIPLYRMRGYIKERLSVNGYSTRIRRVDPTAWTYKNICSYIIDLEAQGYEIHACFIDYLFKVSKAGCNSSGAIGSDVKDLFTRMRNFFAARKTLCVTPHQLSSESFNIIRQGNPEERFVIDVCGRGYYEGVRSLDTDVDVDMYTHVFSKNKETYLAVYKGKHKGTVTKPDDRYALYKFPRGLPIPPDLHSQDSSFKKLPTVSSNADESLFTF